jgi:allantoate deiminase
VEGTGRLRELAQTIWERCEALARFSEHEGQLTRVFLSKELRDAVELVTTWMRDAGMTVREDAIGNVIGRYEGEPPDLPCLMIGSHLDTVRDAGKYDGMLGVLAGIACVDALASAGRRLPFAIEVIGFADEEGTRFQSTLLGSRAAAGRFDAAALDLKDADGTTVRQAMRAYGLDPELIDTAARRPNDVRAYIELHIEQGPVLEAKALPVGVVTAINGATRMQVEIGGTAGHAGTVPMTLRRDALAGAAEGLLAVERIARATPAGVGTVGWIAAVPGSVNVIPGEVRFSIDIRAPKDDDRGAAVAAVHSELREVCRRRDLQLKINTTFDSPSCRCADWLRRQLGSAIAAEGLPVHEVPSGAGHDGMAMIELTDIGMLFLRCKGGVSHHPAEAVTLDDIEASLRVLLRFVTEFEPPKASR